MIAVDINGCVTMINPAAEEITGYLERDLHGKYYGDVFEGRSFSSPVLDTLKRGIEHVSLEIAYPARDRTIQIRRDKDNPQCHRNGCAAGVTPLLDQDGKPVMLEK